MNTFPYQISGSFRMKVSNLYILVNYAYPQLRYKLTKFLIHDKKSENNNREENTQH